MDDELRSRGDRNPLPRPPRAGPAIGEKSELYGDYSDSKDCTSPFAPITVNEMESRQG